MKLSAVVKEIEAVLPKKLAEKWDNTGLLVEPLSEQTVSTIFFTNDLTESVLEEALSVKANMIVAYHPPIFSSLKSLSFQRWKDRIVMKCIQNNIAIYSPHTACDAVEGGVNDWLLSCFDIKDIRPITQSPGDVNSIIEYFSQKDIDLTQVLCSYSDFKLLQKSAFDDKFNYKILVKSEISSQVSKTLSACPDVLAVNVKDCTRLDCLFLTGMGRVGRLQKPISLGNCIDQVKNHVKLKHIRVAIADNQTLDSTIGSIAVCAGSGASLLRDVPADLYITGEMSHHDMLDCTHKKTSVILCEHSNSERGYLEHLVNKLQPQIRGVNFVISKIDKDPVSIV